MRSAGGTSISSMTSKVSMERFIYNLGVLDGLLTKGDNWTLGEFDAETLEPFKYWAGLVKYLKDVGFFKSPRRISHL